MKLTPKQKKFADEYIATSNATQAAISAGYSESSARQIATENLTKPAIVAYINQKLEGHEFDMQVRQKQVLDYAVRVLHEEETEEHAFVTESEGIQVVRLRPKIKDKTDAAKFILSLASVVEKNRLQNIKLEQEIKKLRKELESESSTEDKLKEYFDILDGEVHEET